MQAPFTPYLKTYWLPHVDWEFITIVCESLTAVHFITTIGAVKFSVTHVRHEGTALFVVTCEMPVETVLIITRSRLAVVFVFSISAVRPTVTNLVAECKNQIIIIIMY